MLKLTAHIIAHTQLAPDIWLIRLNCPETFVFLPGQYVLVHIDHQDPSTKAPYPRAYSIAGYVGTVAEDGRVHASEISLIYKRYAGGVATTCLESKKTGDSLTIQGPAGHYTLARHLSNESKVLNFVVTGTGIAPVLCMLQSLAEAASCELRVINLFWGLPTRHDVYLHKDLINLKKDFARRSVDFSITLCLSQEKAGALSDIDQCEVFGSRIQPVLDKKYSLHDNSQENSLSSDLFSLCGSGAFVQDMRLHLISRGVTPKQIVFERFS